MKTWIQKHFGVVLGLAVLVSATGAYSLSERVDRYGGGFPVDFNKGLYVTGITDKQNKVTKLLATQCDYDFPSMGGAAVATGYAFDSNACALPGVVLDDPCFVGIPRSLTQYDDAGTGILGAEFSAYVSDAGFVKVRIHPMVKTDGGAGLGLIDPIDAGYKVRCISNQ